MSESLISYNGGAPDATAPDPVDQRINGTFADFGRVIGALAVPTDHGGSIPTAYRAYQALENARHTLARVAEDTASAIEAVQKDTDPRLTPEIKDAIIRQNVGLFDIAKQDA